MHVTIFESVHAPALPEHQLDLTWGELATTLLTFFKSDGKEKNSLFNLWQFKDVLIAEPGGRNKIDPRTRIKDLSVWIPYPGTIRRCKENAIGLHGLVIDFDHNKTIVEAEELYKEYEYVIYTTFSHSKKEDKFRMVFPFDRMMTRLEFTEKKAAIEAMFPGADRASYSVSQAIYFHSGPDETLAYSRWNRGKFIEVDSFNSVVQPVPRAQLQSPGITIDTMSGDFLQRRKEKVMQHLLSCRGIRRGGGDALILAQICKSVDASFVEFQQICAICCALDSCMQDPTNQVNAWETAFTRITNERRDEFIMQYGGTAVGKVKPVSRTATASEIAKMILNKYKTKDVV
jgi:hypothetical protein